MAGKINLPGEMLQKEALKTFPAKEKEEYVSNVLKKILDINPEGVTISQIKEASGLTYSTVWHHLEILSSTAQSRKISRGNLDVYYPPGEVTHLDYHDGGKIHYAISTVKNSEGNFVYIHEKRENRLGNHSICKGITIPFELTDDIIEALSKAKKTILK